MNAQSAVASVSAAGVFPTLMPRSVQAGTSILLNPTAKLLTTFSRGAGVQQFTIHTIRQERYKAVAVDNLGFDCRIRRRQAVGPNFSVARILNPVQSGVRNAAGHENTWLRHG